MDCNRYLEADEETIQALRSTPGYVIGTNGEPDTFAGAFVRTWVQREGQRELRLRLCVSEDLIADQHFPLADFVADEAGKAARKAAERLRAPNVKMRPPVVCDGEDT